MTPSHCSSLRPSQYLQFPQSWKIAAFIIENRAVDVWPAMIFQFYRACVYSARFFRHICIYVYIQYTCVCI